MHRSAFALFLTGALLLSAPTADAQTMATTDDGRRVVLHPNGIWESAAPVDGEDAAAVIFGITALEPTSPDRPSCTVLSRFDNETDFAVGSAAIDVQYYDMDGNMIVSEVEWIGNLASGHSSREQRLLVALHCQNFARAFLRVRHCYFAPRGDCETAFRSHPDTVIPVNF